MEPSEAIPPIPKRPLTAYNLFCILERNHIVQQNQKIHSNPNPINAHDPNLDPYVAERPQKYRDVVLPSNWYVVGMNRKKRSDHQNHGVISFKNLSKTLGDSWNAADEEVKAYCQKVADAELRRYRRDQTAYKERYGEEAFESQKRKYRKRPKKSVDRSDGKKICKEDHLYVEDDSHSEGESSNTSHDHSDIIQNRPEVGYSNSYRKRVLVPSSAHYLSSGVSESFVRSGEGLSNKKNWDRRGSGDSSDFSVGEWLVNGQEEANAFDSDD
ncbi:hypothetical protein ACHAWX_000724 [Stephanocyclus meneghinianus]